MELLEKNGEIKTCTYTYDAFDRVVEIDQNDCITKMNYDSQGRTSKIVTPEGTVSYTYDSFGRQTSVQADNDPPTSYTYDQFGRPATGTSDDVIICCEYDAHGNLARTRILNGVTTTYEYDNMNRLTRLLNFVDANNDGIWNNGEERISQFVYSLDDLGRKTKAEEYFGNGNLQKSEIDWEYDNADRLIREVFDHYELLMKAIGTDMDREEFKEEFFHFLYRPAFSHFDKIEHWRDGRCFIEEREEPVRKAFAALLPSIVLFLDICKCRPGSRRCLRRSRQKWHLPIQPAVGSNSEARCFHALTVRHCGRTLDRKSTPILALDSKMPMTCDDLNKRNIGTKKRACDDGWKTTRGSRWHRRKNPRRRSKTTALQLEQVS